MDENKKFNIIIGFTVLFLISYSIYLVFLTFNFKRVNNDILAFNHTSSNLAFENTNSLDLILEKLKNIDNKLNDPDFKNKIDEIINVQKHIDTSDGGDFQKAIEISKSTPLDLVTSSIIIKYSNLLDLPPSLILGLIELESNFKQYEVGRDNDRGYCQIIPGTEKWLADTYGHMIGLTYDKERIFEPDYNIGLGSLYLHILKKAHGEDYHKILSEYNRGIYNLTKYYNTHGTYVTSYSRGVLNRERKYKTLN